MMPSPATGIVHVAGGKTRARVLIVDDEPLVRWSLASALLVAGFDPVTASCGAEAAALACARPAPEVILVDLELYDTDARVLVDQIRAVAPACRVLALTTSGAEVAVRPPWLAVTFIRKPFDLADVVRLVEREVA
jgi:DNA-binding NtrC family response regulator